MLVLSTFGPEHDNFTLIEQLKVGPVHLTGQDISGATVFRLATTHTEDVLSSPLWRHLAH
jgi:hypothetical protein